MNNKYSKQPVPKEFQFLYTKMIWDAISVFLAFQRREGRVSEAAYYKSKFIFETNHVRKNEHGELISDNQCQVNMDHWDRYCKEVGCNKD